MYIWTHCSASYVFDTYNMSRSFSVRISDQVTYHLAFKWADTPLTCDLKIIKYQYFYHCDCCQCPWSSTAIFL